MRLCSSCRADDDYNICLSCNLYSSRAEDDRTFAQIRSDRMKAEIRWQIFKLYRKLLYCHSAQPVTSSFFFPRRGTRDANGGNDEFRFPRQFVTPKKLPPSAAELYTDARRTRGKDELERCKKAFPTSTQVGRENLGDLVESHFTE